MTSFSPYLMPSLSSRNVLSLLVASLLLAACSNESDPLTPSTTPASIQPLAVGNSWTYRRTDADPGGGTRTRIFTDSIVRDTLIASERFFILSRGFSDSSRLETVVTNRSGSLWIHALDKTFIAYKHPAVMGERFRSIVADSCLVADTAVVVAVPAGTFRCWKYVGEESHLTVYMAPGVGMIKWEDRYGEIVHSEPPTIDELISRTIN